MVVATSGGVRQHGRQRSLAGLGGGGIVACGSRDNRWKQRRRPEAVQATGDGGGRQSMVEIGLMLGNAATDTDDRWPGSTDPGLASDGDEGNGVDGSMDLKLVLIRGGRRQARRRWRDLCRLDLAAVVGNVLRPHWIWTKLNVVGKMEALDCPTGYSPSVGVAIGDVDGMERSGWNDGSDDIISRGSDPPIGPQL
ncbi:hypothetical protein ACLOJK_006537 [Asimina triloba]